MNLNLKAFSQLVEDMGAALQSSASTLIDVSVGSVVRAIFEANASVVLWLQWLVLQVLQTTRASTSNGSDLDSWMLDFGLTRLPAVPSTGIVTFSRFANNVSATIPAGTVVKTTDGSLSFSVTIDQTLSIWRSSASAYVLPSGVASVDLPVICVTGGSVGNVLADTITVIAASLPGIDLVANANPLSNGADAESDAAFRTRFQSYLASRSRATLTAVRNAIANVQQGLNVEIEENISPEGTTQVGCFLVIVDDGTGYPSTTLLSTIATAVDAVRPVGTRFAVVPPQVLTVNVSLAAVLTSATTTSLSVPSIQNCVAIYLNSLPIGRGASVTRVAQNAYLAGAGIENVTGILLNGSPSDISAPAGTVIKAGQVVISTNDGCDLSDFVFRLRAVLPKRWFAEQSPNLGALLTSIATPWVWLYNLITYVIAQTRLATATDEWLDLIAIDCFGYKLIRKTNEADFSYKNRIQAALLREAATRPAVEAGLQGLIGTQPVIFEPANCMDTGSYGYAAGTAIIPCTGMAYGQAGGWGSLQLPLQFFVTATRPPTPGVGIIAGYGAPNGGYGEGAINYVNLSLLPGHVTDADIQAMLSKLLPVNAVAWLRII